MGVLYSRLQNSSCKEKWWMSFTIVFYNWFHPLFWLSNLWVSHSSFPFFFLLERPLVLHSDNGSGSKLLMQRKMMNVLYNYQQSFGRLWALAYTTIPFRNFYTTVRSKHCGLRASSDNRCLLHCRRNASIGGGYGLLGFITCAAHQQSVAAFWSAIWANAHKQHTQRDHRTTATFARGPEHFRNTQRWYPHCWQVPGCCR